MKRVTVFGLSLFAVLTLVLSAAEDGVIRLENGDAVLTFAPAARNYAFESLRLKKASSAVFGSGLEPLWSVKLGEPRYDGSGGECSFDATKPADKSFRFFVADHGGQGIEFSWKNLSSDLDDHTFDVTVKVILRGKRAEWFIFVTNRSKEYGIDHVEFPHLGGLIVPGAGDVLMPGGFFGAALFRNSKEEGFFDYPSGYMPFPFAAAIRNGQGVYFGAQDPRNFVKFLRITKNQSFSIGQYPEAMCKAQTGYASVYPVISELFEGDWYAAADIHRQYLLDAGILTSQNRLSKRPIPVEFKEAGVQMTIWQNRPASYVHQARRFFNAPLLNFWCEWGVNRFDRNFPEQFPIRDGVDREAKSILRGGNLPMPYMNPRGWGSENAMFNMPEVQKSLVVRYNGDHATDFSYSLPDGRKEQSFIVCPSAKLWREVCADTCTRLAKELKVPAVYMDQVAASKAILCFSPHHGHASGGAADYVANYRKIVETIHANSGLPASQRLALVTEQSGEAWVGAYDGFLHCWWMRFNGAECVPLTAYLLSGYVLLIPHNDNYSIQSLDAYCMIQGRYFLWGMPQVSHQNEFESRKYPGGEESVSVAMHAFLKKLVNMRQKHKAFLIYGSLLREVAPTNQVESFGADWKLSRTGKEILLPVTFPAVQASLWRTEGGKKGIALVNYSPKAQLFESEIDGVSVHREVPPRSCDFLEL